MLKEPDRAIFSPSESWYQFCNPRKTFSPANQQERGVSMQQQAKEPKDSDRKGFLDYLLYLLAGSVFAVIGFSFLLWLRF
jgi:hypothetical protein